MVSLPLKLTMVTQPASGSEETAFASAFQLCFIVINTLLNYYLEKTIKEHRYIVIIFTSYFTD